jgi:hypothetical protein
MSNWVDRGEPAEPHLVRVLAFFLEREPAAHATWLHQQAVIVRGMVDANASEVQVASFVGYLEELLGRPISPAPTRRGVAIALWHIAKAGLTRDRLLSDSRDVSRRQRRKSRSPTG